MRDLILKQFILENNIYDEYLSFKREWISAYRTDIIEEKELGYYCSDLKEKDFINRYGTDVLRVCHNLDVNRWRKKRLIKQRINFMFMRGKCLFITFTFSDDYLNSSEIKNRRRRVLSFLKRNGSAYICNIDFGERDFYIDPNGAVKRGTHREHYHAVLLCDEIPQCQFDFWSKKYGNVYAERICKPNSDSRISKYIVKLSFHAIKDSTKSFRVMYGGFNNVDCKK